MGANIFQIEGKAVHSLEKFRNNIIDNKISNIIYYPNEFRLNDRKFLKFVNVEFKEISFKDTFFKNCIFINCKFNKCLFLGCIIKNTEFDNCIFIYCNTSKLKLIDSRLNPRSFDNNFDQINDTNISTDLYRTLYDNAMKTHQTDYASYALYKFNRSKEYNHDYKYRSGKLDFKKYLTKKLRYRIHYLVSGYGLQNWKIIVSFVVYVLLCGFINFKFSEYVFGLSSKGTLCVNSITDSIYFTFISVTTIGFGDISPGTYIGKYAVMFESAIGIILIAHGLNVFTKGDK